MSRATSHHRRIAVLQHEAETQLGVFAHVLADAGVDYELVCTRAGRFPHPADVDGVVVLGGSLAATDVSLARCRRWIRAAVSLDTPYFGVCLGAQLLAQALGGRVVRDGRPEVGVHDVFVTSAGRRDLLFETPPRRFPVLGWHEDTFTLPPGALPLAGSMAYRNQAFRYGTNAYGVQFHLEAGTADMARWATVPRYADMLERSGTDAERLSPALAATAPALRQVARAMLERWLLIVTGTAAVRQTRLQLPG